MLNKYLEVAEEIAIKAGKMLVDGFSMEIHTDWKADGSPLTATDNAINRMVIEEIAKNFPDHSVLGEEESTESQNKMLWVCDPVDGTIPYSHGLNISTFSLALVEDGIPILGIMYDPFQNLFFKATLEQSTLMNGKPVRVNNRDTLKNAVIEIEAPNAGELFKSLDPMYSLPTQFQSFGFGAKMVASGHFTGAIFGWNHPWDCAAIKILVEQAGGKTSDYDGNDQRYDQKLNGFIASNGLVHDELLERVKKANKESKINNQ